MTEYTDIKKRLAELTKQRDRTDKKPLSTDERKILLDEIYDGLLYLWKQAVIMGTAKGTSAISHQLERARLEYISLTGSKSADDRVINIFFKPVPGGDDEKATEEEAST